MTESIRTGLVGAGGLGTRLATMAANDARGTVEAIVEIDDDRREQVGDQLGVPADRRFTDDPALYDAVDLDAVLIATPHALHYDQIVRAIEHDVHVLCEKPLTVDLEHARDLRERDAGTDRVVMVGYQRHIQGPYYGAREHVRSWDDHPKFITAQITQNWINSQRGSWRTNPELSGGGQLYDTGSHILDVVLWASGLTPTAVTASMVRWDEDPDVDIQAAVTIEFAEDAVASVAVSGDAPTVREHHRMWGDEGAVAIDGIGWNDRVLRTIDPDGAERQPGVRDRVTNKVVAFLDAIETGEAPPSTTEHAFDVTAVTEAAYEADRTGERVTIDR